MLLQTEVIFFPHESVPKLPKWVNAYLGYHAQPIGCCGMQGSHPGRTRVTLSSLSVVKKFET